MVLNPYIVKQFLSLQKVETKNGETVAVIYFDSLTSESVCPVVKAYKTHRVAQLKPAAVVVYDYYDDSKYPLSL